MDWTPPIVIAAISLLVSVAVATWNIVDRFMNRSEERKRRAPILTSTISCSQGDVEGKPAAGRDLDGKSLRFTFTVETTNSGINTAERIETEVLFTYDLEENGQIPRNGPAWWISFANALPQSKSSQHAESFILQGVPRRWIRIEHKFTDSQTGKRKKLSCGYVWGGTRDNQIQDMSTAQLDMLKAHLDGLTDQQLVEHFYWNRKRPGLPIPGGFPGKVLQSGVNE